VFSKQCRSENELDINRIPYRRSVSPRTGPEFQRHQHIAKLPVVTAILRWIETEKLRIATFIDVEIRREVITANGRGSG
jgi:hypothetical protein